MVNNQIHMRAMKIVLISGVFMIIGSIVYAIVGDVEDRSLAVFMGIISALIIIQVVFLKPAFISISKNGDELWVHARSLFNPTNKTEVHVMLKDIVGYKIVPGKKIIGGRLVIEYKQQNEPVSITVYLVNFTLLRRNKLIKYLSETIK
jgi:hypothetical protein